MTGQEGDSEGISVKAFKQKHKRLYGRLMIANEQLDDTGTFLIWYMAVAAIFLCVSIHMRWFYNICGIDVEQLQSGWVYFLIGITSFVAFVSIGNHMENTVYLELRQSILDEIDRSDLSLETLLTDISEDNALEEIREKLMNDKSITKPDRSIV